MHEVWEADSPGLVRGRGVGRTGRRGGSQPEASQLLEVGASCRFDEMNKWVKDREKVPSGTRWGALVVPPGYDSDKDEASLGSMISRTE